MSNDNIIFGRTQLAIQTPFDNTTAGAVDCGFTATEVQTAIEEACQLAPGTASRFIAVFGDNGVVKNAFLEFFAGNPSDLIPFVCAEPLELKALSIAVKTSTTGEVEIYKNGVTLVTSITLTAQSTNFVSGLSFSFAAGDTISVFVNNVGSLRDPICSVFLQTV